MRGYSRSSNFLVIFLNLLAILGFVSTNFPSSCTADDGTCISCGGGSASGPQISGELAVWYANKGIYVYDLNSKSVKKVANLTLADTPTSFGESSHPAIANNLIVWDDNKDSARGNWDIYACEYNRQTGACPVQQVTTNAANQFLPRVSDKGLIVWVDGRNRALNPQYSNNDIYACAYDPMLHKCSAEHQVTSDLSEQYAPDVSGYQIVWHDERNGGSRDVYTCLYDPATGSCSSETKVNTTVNGEFVAPSISGSRIVWQEGGSRDPAAPSWGIYLYDLQHPEVGIQPIALRPQAQGVSPRIDGDLIVWQDTRSNGHFDLYTYDLTNKTERQLTFDPGNEVDAAISSGRVVFVSYRSGQAQVYLKEIPGEANHAPELAPIADQRIREGRLLAVAISATDQDGDPLTLSARLANGSPLSALGNATLSNNGGTGTLKWTPAYDFVKRPKPYQDVLVVVEASDGKATSSAMFRIRVSNARDGNQSPTVLPIPTMNVTVGQPVQFKVQAADPDRDPLTYTFSMWTSLTINGTSVRFNLDEGATLDSRTGVFSWTPRYVRFAPGVNLDITVSDGLLSATTQTTINTFPSASRPLAMQPLPGPIPATPGATITLRLHAYDLGGRPLTYTCPKSTDGRDAGGWCSSGTLNPQTGDFTWVAGPAEIGGKPLDYPFSFQVSNGQSTDNTTVAIRVKP